LQVADAFKHKPVVSIGSVSVVLAYRLVNQQRLATFFCQNARNVQSRILIETKRMVEPTQHEISIVSRCTIAVEVTAFAQVMRKVP
jgi:hypothetical protein